MSKRLIDANEFNRSPAFLCGGFPGDPYYDGYCDALDRIQEALQQFPTVDAVPVVHGQWIGGYSGTSYTIPKCSRCGYGNGAVGAASYCPNCGSTMRKEEAE